MSGMPDVTIHGEPLTEAAKLNLARFKAIAETRLRIQEETEAKKDRQRRAGVKVLSAAEKQAFLAARPDLR